MEGYLSTVGGVRVIQNPEDPQRHNLSIDNKDVGQMHVGIAGGETKLAKRMFPMLVKDTDKVSRIHGVSIDDDLQGFGLGQLLYLRTFDTPGIDWFYNSQTYPPATNVLKALAGENKNDPHLPYIEIHWYPRKPNWNEEGGNHLVRITPAGKKAYLMNKSIKQNELQSYWKNQGSKLER